MQYEAELSDGNDLPYFITFQGKRFTFITSDVADAADYNIVVRAILTGGPTVVTETFTFTVTVGQCSDGEYWTGTKCSACDASCVRCDGPTANDCISCQADEFLSEAGTCETCGEACASCANAVAVDTCDVCVDNASLSTGACSCDSGFVFNAATGVCDACSEGCNECTSATQCTTCNNPVYFSDDAGGCEIKSCPSGQYLNMDNGNCIACGDNCRTCDADGC